MTNGRISDSFRKVVQDGGGSHSLKGRYKTTHFASFASVRARSLELPAQCGCGMTIVRAARKRSCGSYSLSSRVPELSLCCVSLPRASAGLAQASWGDRLGDLHPAFRLATNDADHSSGSQRPQENFSPAYRPKRCRDASIGVPFSFALYSSCGGTCSPTTYRK